MATRPALGAEQPVTRVNAGLRGCSEEEWAVSLPQE